MLIILIFFISNFCNAQDLLVHNSLFGRSYKDKVLLRWMPPNASVWNHAKSRGYKISKAEYKGESIESFTNLSYVEIEGSPYKQYTEDELELIAAKNNISLDEDDFEKLVLAYSYSSEVNPENYGDIYPDDIFSKGLNSVSQAKSNENLRFLIAMLACEQSALGAEFAGFRTTDFMVEYGKDYIYKLELVEPHPIYQVAPSYLKLKIQNFDPDLYKTKVFVKEAHEKISLSWTPLDFMSGYHVEISSDNQNFERITEVPIGNVSVPNKIGKNFSTHVADSLVIGKKYYFKIIGMTSFADELVIGFADGTPKDVSPPSSPYIDSLVVTERNKMMVYWDNSVHDNSDIAGYEIGRAHSDTSKFFKIHEGLIPSDRNSFQDVYFKESEINFYLLSAVDLDGNKSYSSKRLLVVEDLYPPEVPTLLSGEIDSAGQVLIKIAPNKEKDFLGYNVYKANALEHEYSASSSTWVDSNLVMNIDTFYLRDSTILETLTSELFFRLSSVDTSYNESFFSDTLRIVRPDINPPVPPLINDYTLLIDSILFSITVSSSNDVVNNYIFRKKQSDEEWILLDSVGVQDTVFKYFAEESNQLFEYTMKAKDKSGLESDYGNVIRLKALKKPNKLDMVVECNYYSEIKSVFLTWDLQQPINQELYHSIYVSDATGTKSYGMSKFSNGALYKTDAIPQEIKIKSRSNMIEYLPLRFNGCVSSDEEIEKTELLNQLNPYENED